MISSRHNNRNNLEKLNLERRVDQFVEAGRQFVDGVSGARPGTRRSTSIKELSRRKVNNVTEWVSKKVDSIFEDEDNYDYENVYKNDWDDRFAQEPKDISKNYSRNQKSLQNKNKLQKRPLTAISLRSAESKPKILKPLEDDWPDAEAFQIDRWKRDKVKDEELNLRNNDTERTSIKGRNLPKSSRRRIQF